MNFHGRGYNRFETEFRNGPQFNKAAHRNSQQGRPQAEPYRVQMAADGQLELPVYLAEIKSQMGQRAYLDYFHRTTMLTNWRNVNDFPEWEFELRRDGKFEVLASYAWQWGGKSSFLVEIDDREVLRGESQPSPSIYFAATHSLVQVELAAGKHVLRFKITAIANNNALKLEKVVLRPAAGRWQQINNNHKF